MFELFQKGGLVMYPLLACSIAALAIVIERFVNLRASKALRPSVADTVDGLVESGVYEKAKSLCERSPSPYTNIVGAVLENPTLPREELKEIVLEASRHELPVLTRYLPTLSTLASVSPLLGLLGTVLGMREIFDVIAHMGTGTASALGAGISKALITTVSGLSIAIPALIFHNYFQNHAEALITEIEKRTLRLVRAISERGAAGPADLRED
ncbi:MAG: MotA/TolQ/ExbB proton channel family protein [Acidobacteriota bacterium]|nr:MAG: MotA/TolQ/ExbB proton channel family protein [Acidobacteriota bacterium]